MYKNKKGKALTLSVVSMVFAIFVFCGLLKTGVLTHFTNMELFTMNQDIHLLINPIPDGNR